MKPSHSMAVGFLVGLSVAMVVGLWMRGSGDVSVPRLGDAEQGSVRRPAALAFSSAGGRGTHPERVEEFIRTGNTAAWRTAVGRWGQDDPAAAWEYVWNSISPDWLKRHPEVLLRLARDWASRDPAALQAALLELPATFYAGQTEAQRHKIHHPPAFARLLVTLARIDPVAAFDVVRQKSGAVHEYTSSFLGEFASESPAEAAQLARELPAGEARDRAVLAVTAKWQVTDPSSALAFAQAHLAPHQYRKVLEKTLNAVSKEDPGAVAPALTNLPPGRFRADWIDRVTAHWMSQDPHACAAWIGGLPSGPDRERALQSSATSLGATDPLQAIEVARALESATRQRIVLYNVLRQWAKSDAAAATAYAHSLPDDQTRTDVLKLLHPPPTAPPSTEGMLAIPDLKAPPLWETPTLNLDAPSPAPAPRILR